MTADKGLGGCFHCGCLGRGAAEPALGSQADLYEHQHDGPGRQPTLTFDVSAPNSSNLKSKPDEKREVGERCLKLWEVVVDDDDAE